MTVIVYECSFSSASVSVLVLDMKSDLLAGAEWGYVLSVLGGTISQLKTLVTNEERYLQDMESDERSAALKKRLQNRFFVEQVCV